MNEVTPPSRFAPGSLGDVHYQEMGEGDAVLLLHGGGPGAYGWSNFRRNVAELAKRFRVIVMDLPGYGQSPHRDRPEGVYQSLAEAVRDVMDHAGVAKASLVGNSLGGGTAVRFAMDHPERVARLVLMGPGGGVPIFTPMPTEGLGRMQRFFEGEGPTLEKLNAVIDLLVYDRSTITEDLVAERFKTATLPSTMASPTIRSGGRHANDDLWRKDLSDISAPTLLIWGREDRVVPLDSALLWLKVIPNADLHVFSKCGHWAQWERADEFNAVVGDFLAR